MNFKCWGAMQMYLFVFCYLVFVSLLLFFFQYFRVNNLVSFIVYYELHKLSCEILRYISLEIVLLYFLFLKFLELL